jgi:hypothetical protein
MIASQRPAMHLGDLLEYFVHHATIDDMYFMCDISDMRRAAGALAEVPLSLRYTTHATLS